MKKASVVFDQLMGYSGVFITLATGVAYISSIIFQRTYLGLYGVDASLINIKLDAEAVMAGVIMVLISAVFVLGLVWLTERSIQFIVSGKLLNSIILDVVILVSGVASIVMTLINYPAFSHQSDIVNKVLLSATSALITIYVAIKPFQVRYIMRKRHESLKDAYIQFTMGTIVPKQEDSKSKVSGRRIASPAWLIVIFSIMFGTLAFPTALARSLVENKVSYSYLVNESSDKTKMLIISNSADGFVVKKYYTDKKIFDDNFQIAKYTGGDIGSFSISPIKGKALSLSLTP